MASDLMREAWENPPYGAEAIAVGAFVTLTNVGASYDAINASRGLGFALVDFTNVTTIRFDVHVNKIGTGTQDWQLWNETDGAEIGVISDAGGTGNKFLTTTISGINLSGIKRVRVRSRSSVAADDPLYYGAAILVG